MGLWQDKDFQYSALFRSYLPKLAVETAGVEPGSEEMNLTLEQRDAAVEAWMGWPRKSAVVVLLSIVVYLLSMVLNTATELGLSDDDGNESMPMIGLRAAALVLGGAGSCVFMYNNISWRRLHYTFTSTQGILWMVYTLIYALAGFARPQLDAPVSSVLGTLYPTLGLVLWLSFESVQRISRVMHTTITFVIALTLAVTIYLTAYVWNDDRVLGDLNGDDKPGLVTQFSVQRVAFMNLLLLMAGSLVTVAKKNLTLNSYFAFVSGNVLRREILEIESLSIDPDGHHDLIGHNALEHLKRSHTSITGFRLSDV